MKEDTLHHFLFTTHYFEYETDEGNGGNSMCYYNDNEEDTLATELEEAIQKREESQPHYPPGHPVYVRQGTEFVEAEPGSPEAGYAHLPGHCGLQKL